MEIVNSIAPFELAEEWDNVGLLAGNPDHQVERVLCALDLRMDVVEEALRRDCQLIVGPVLLERMPGELAPYAAFRLRVARKALAGASVSEDPAQQAPLEQEIAIWEEVCACLQR